MRGLVDTRQQFSHLAELYLPIAVFVLVLVTGLMVAFVVRYRHASPSAKPHSAPWLEAGFAGFLIVVAALLIGATFRTESRVDRLAKRPGLVIDVVAAQWSWRFDYPGLRISRVGPFQRPTTLVVPAHTTVRLRLRSQDVIHAFYVPKLRFKRDAFPDRTTRFDLDFDQPGHFSGACAEFCGLNHADMTFSVRVLRPAAFARWARRQGGS